MNPVKNRASGVKINHKAADYKKFVKEVAELVKDHGKEMAFVTSSYATNEELALAKQLVEASGIKAIFSKSDRVWDEKTCEVKSDDILVTEDKIPNTAGVKKTFLHAKDISNLVLSDYKYAFVWGQNAPIENLSGLQLIAISAIKDQVFEKAKWSIAGRISTEKHGSFTNIDGIMQPFRRAIKGDNNFDELMFFVDVLKELDVQPIGRTVDEIRKTIK